MRLFPDFFYTKPVGWILFFGNITFIGVDLARGWYGCLVVNILSACFVATALFDDEEGAR